MMSRPLVTHHFAGPGLANSSETLCSLAGGNIIVAICGSNVQARFFFLFFFFFYSFFPFFLTYRHVNVRVQEDAALLPFADLSQIGLPCLPDTCVNSTRVLWLSRYATRASIHKWQKYNLEFRIHFLKILVSFWCRRLAPTDYYLLWNL